MSSLVSRTPVGICRTPTDLLLPVRKIVNTVVTCSCGKEIYLELAFGRLHTQNTNGRYMFLTPPHVNANDRIQLWLTLILFRSKFSRLGGGHRRTHCV